MSGSALYSKAGNFRKTLDNALAYRYVAVYRPGASGMEAFVFDVRTVELLAAFRWADACSFADGRKALERGLERATGGSFEFD